ncbi:hypothetical protein B0G93_110101 [Bacillus sp. V-88]|uniref:Uncharacterized protein n=1 Tax=Rossellomorea vietnamensis TaxID=218284 RepID=A0A6I6UMD1_9BACI|nr:hypothetical protein [Rossellomorea vietnamensis]OXS59617.1 hypothetical protein B1B00_11885 [Bacillus sp. DSM 27956]PRX76149.1 hypothetical protein B0G93_110101 [Bacillus sp. V-88]QHE62477.1 hypothetical protein FHE72_16720 [Rossellomorea vietnamensis]SLK23196.1 hypothetical protein SAMN06295884_110101 [Bacillus sp. V-88]
MSEKTFQVGLWLTAVLGSLALFVATKIIWKEANEVLLLVYLVVGFLVNLIVSKIRSMRTEETRHIG